MLCRMVISDWIVPGWIFQQWEAQLYALILILRYIKLHEEFLTCAAIECRHVPIRVIVAVSHLYQVSGNLSLVTEVAVVYVSGFLG
jgi:hypothetical protein